MTQARILDPTDGKIFTTANSKINMKVLSSETDNRLSLAEYTLPPEFPGPPPHVHRVYEHIWYILEGSIQISLDDETFEATPGTCIHIPPGTPHTFSNPSSETARVLAIDTPGGFEGYYEELQAAFSPGTLPDPVTIREIQARYDTYPPDESL